MKTTKYWGHFQLKLNNMLVKKIKWLNDLGKFAQGSKTEERFEEQYIKISTTSQACW